MARLHPTPYPDVNAMLGTLLAEVQAILRDRFLGLYLYGSLASGHFDPGSSDIDFLVVTTEELAEEQISALGAMHDRLIDGGDRWGKELDGDYMPVALLRRYDPNRSQYPHVGWGERLRVEGHGIDTVITRHQLRESGVIVAGPPPVTLIDPVSPDELKEAVRVIAREWWVPAVDDPKRLSTPHDLMFVVLTMCRLLYTVEYGMIAPKPVAAAWAREFVEARWRPLIARAAARELEQSDYAETREFLRYTLGRIL